MVGSWGYELFLLGVKHMRTLPQLKRTCQFLFWGAKEVLTSPALHLKYFLPSPQIYAMTLTLPFGLGSGVDVSSSMDNTYQQFDPQGRWQANSMDPGADPSIYSRSQAPSIQGGFGTYVRLI